MSIHLTKYQTTSIFQSPWKVDNYSFGQETWRLVMKRWAEVFIWYSFLVMSPTSIHCMGFVAQLIYLTASVCELNKLYASYTVCLLVYGLFNGAFNSSNYVCIEPSGPLYVPEGLRVSRRKPRAALTRIYRLSSDWISVERRLLWDSENRNQHFAITHISRNKYEYVEIHTKNIHVHNMANMRHTYTTTSVLR